MNLAWEVVLQAEKDMRSRERLRFVEAKAPSPYMEVSLIDLNLEAPEEDRIEINPLYRFEDVFGRIFDRNVEGMDATREIFFDVCMHYVTQLDLREGLAKEDYYCSLLAADLNRGSYGVKAKERFGLFKGTQQKGLLRSLLQLFRTGNYLEEFRKVVTRLYPHAIIYENNETVQELLVYLGVRETEEEREKAEFLIEAFLPIKETVHIFYENHFGIIDVDETMVLDETVIF